MSAGYGSSAVLRGLLRRRVPAPIRLALARIRRVARDRASGHARLIARACGATEPLPICVGKIAQPIRNTAFLQGKLTNIANGAARIDGIVIEPGQIFSFWALVGRPSAEAGFQLGRSIRGGMVDGDIGGGLCQLSGIAYELMLRAGMEIVERHPHSRDLYDDVERFTPLGLDATVVWPYRDLRMRNTLRRSVALCFRVEGMTLHASLWSDAPSVPAAITIDRVDHPAWREVRVLRDAVQISHDRYAVGP